MTPPHLLLVDDSPEVGVLVRALARRAGQAVTVARDVEGAREALAREGFDLVLLDVNLTGASGLDLLRHRPAPRPPIALFCQPELTGDVAAGWALGADFLVSKALLGDPARWQARVAEVLARGNGHPAPAGVECPAKTEQAPPCDPSSRAAAFVRATQHPVFRPLGPGLLDEVLRRALSGLPGHDPGRLAGPLHPGRPGELLQTSSFSPIDARRLCAAVVDQLWRLSGAELSRAAEEVFSAEVLLGLG